MITYRYLQDTRSSEERSKSKPKGSEDSDEKRQLTKGIPPQRLVIRSPKQATAIRQISPTKLIRSDRVNSEAGQSKLVSDGGYLGRPPVSKRKKEKRPPVELNDVLSSPKDNEAYHDDRPTQEDADSPEPIRVKAR